MKIALVSPYDFAYPGGVTNHISALERHLVRMGHQVKVIAPVSKAISSFNGHFIPIGKPRPVPASGSIARITISPLLSSQINEVLTKEKFDIIHLHEPLMPMLCTTILRLSHTTTIGTFHAYDGSPAYKIATPLGKLLLKKWFKKLDGRIAVSPPAKEFVGKYFSGEFTIIPNGIELEHFHPRVSPIDKYCDGKLNILFVGRLEKRKGLGYLLKAYRQVKKEVPDSRLIVVGPGTRLRNKYEKYVRQNDLKNVEFVGRVSYDELPRYYQTADVFCSPATGRESFGIVLLEAMAFGKPIVASRIDGYSSVVTNGVEGLLVPPKDDIMLAQALISLMIDKALRQQMGASGRLKTKEYGWERIARRVYGYYEECLEQQASKTMGKTAGSE